MVRDYEYEHNYVGYDEQYPQERGGGIKCKNYEICEAILPKWWYDCKGCYICMNCDTQFGTWENASAGVRYTGKGVLPVVDNAECPICLEVKRSITQPNCEHTLCIECFKRCHYGAPGPIFPYSEEIEDEYYRDRENEKWKDYHLLIDKWEIDCEKWEENRIEREESEEHLIKCPLCRK
jgi:hypothetical protein